MVIQRGTMSRCQGLSHFVREVFLDFDKTDRLVDCSHEFTNRVSSLLNEVVASRFRFLFTCFWRNADIVAIIDIRIAISY